MEVRVRGEDVSFAEAVVCSVIPESAVNAENELEVLLFMGEHVRVVELMPPQGCPRLEERVFTHRFQDSITVSLGSCLESVVH